MGKTKHLLITSDLSPEAEAAFAPAQEQITAFKADGYEVKISLLCVLEPLTSNVSFGYGLAFVDEVGLSNEAKEKAKYDLTQIADKYLTEAAVDPIVVETNDSVYQEITRFAASNNVDQIIMATHGRSGASRLLLGSVTDRVIREAQCPVLVVPSSVE